jgi:hypothetical protein
MRAIIKYIHAGKYSIVHGNDIYIAELTEDKKEWQLFIEEDNTHLGLGKHLEWCNTFRTLTEIKNAFETI